MTTRDPLSLQARLPYIGSILLSLLIGTLVLIHPGLSLGEDSNLPKGVAPPQLLNVAQIKKMITEASTDSKGEDAGRDSVEGEVLTDLSINSRGTVTDVRIIRSSAYKCSQAVWKIAKAMKFSPALKGSEPVAVKTRQRFLFKAEEE